MPTPAGTAPIPTPWIGQGSLVGTYDLEILNDRKNLKDGVYYIILFQQILKSTSKILTLFSTINTEE